MQTTLKVSLWLAVLLMAYLLFWPVPVDPVAWDAPEDKGYINDFLPNQKLAGLELLDIGDVHGPEDVTSQMIDGQLYLYVSSQEGLIQKIHADTLEANTFANTQGVPLGLEFDRNGHLIVADAYRGLLSINPAGKVSVLTDQVNDSPILYADDLDISSDGIIYFSDASTHFGAEAAGVMQGSLLEILEHGRSGRLLAYDPKSQATKVLMNKLSFANGVAMGPNDDSVLVIETGEYRIHRYWLRGEKQGQSEMIIRSLPGFPDNINQAPNGHYYVGLVSKRSEPLDQMSASPFLRKMTWRLPEFMKPKAQDYGLIIEMTADGEVIQTWQDPAGSYPATTGAHAAGDGNLYISSLTANTLARLQME